MAIHAPTETKRLGGLHLRFATKSWSDAFECPVCKRQLRFNLNFLGGKILLCDGSDKKWRRLARWEWAAEQEMKAAANE